VSDSLEDKKKAMKIEPQKQMCFPICIIFTGPGSVWYVGYLSEGLWSMYSNHPDFFWLLPTGGQWQTVTKVTEKSHGCDWQGMLLL